MTWESVLLGNRDNTVQVPSDRHRVQSDDSEIVNVAGDSITIGKGGGWVLVSQKASTRIGLTNGPFQSSLAKMKSPCPAHRKAEH